MALMLRLVCVLPVDGRSVEDFDAVIFEDFDTAVGQCFAICEDLEVGQSLTFGFDNQVMARDVVLAPGSERAVDRSDEEVGHHQQDQD